MLAVTSEVTPAVKVALQIVLRTMRCTAPARTALEAVVGATPFKPSKSYYTTIDGQKFERQLLQEADKLSRDRHISLADAKHLWTSALDGKGVTAIEAATLQYVCSTSERFHCTAAALKYLEEQLRSLNQSVPAEKEAADAMEVDDAVDSTEAEEAAAGASKYTSKELTKFKVVKLRKMLKKHGMPAGGRKAEMIERLLTVK